LIDQRDGVGPAALHVINRPGPAYDGPMSKVDPPWMTLGAIIRKQRELAELPMRQLASTVGISNPYLSQIERGLRAPSEAVLDAIAQSLQTTTDALYTEAGFAPPDQDEDQADLEAAIDTATELTTAQRRAMTEIYHAFVDANVVRRPRKSAKS
jgi:transcriptional regulator with XRE-family HTH domain